MNFLSWLLVALIALWLVAAVVHILRHRGGCSCGGNSGGCCGDCARCAGCADCAKEKGAKSPRRRCG